jgi:hypothetical protein
MTGGRLVVCLGENMTPVRPPPAPVKGMRFFVQTGSHWSMGDNYTIGQVNGRSFYVYHHGGKERFLLVEWTHWLGKRFAEGMVRLEWQVLQRPTLLPKPQENPMASFQVDIRARDKRFLRAAKTVLKNYRLIRTDDGDTVQFEIAGGTNPYTVRVSRSWSLSPICTCPDAQHRAADLTGGFCKHVIAVLIENEDLRCQLLDVLL